MEEDTEFAKLPIEERCVHTVWKARVGGYEAARKLFSQIDEEKSPEWNKYGPLIKKFVLDGNVLAQEKGLEAALVFVENAKIASKNPSDIIAGVVDKALSASKARTRELAVDILLMYVEIEKQDIVMEELLSAIEKKTAKALSVCIQAVTAILRAFGPKVLNLKPLLKQVPKCLENRDKLVREEAKTLCVELYRWIGAALKPQLTELKPILVQELEENFKQVAGERPQRTRYLRSEQEKISKAQEAGDAPGGAVENQDAADAGVEIDPYDLLDPVDILSKLPKDFFEKAEAKKWQERKDSLDVLLDLVNKNPKLESGDYGEVVKLLKKVIAKDSNVNLVAIGAQCLSGLAKGLKKKFHTYAASCLPVVLEKFKEKKAIVVTALREAIDNITVTLTLENFQEDVCGALENKNPSIKAETASFLARFFARSMPTTLANKKILKIYITPLLKTLNESDPQVRDCSAEALGTVLKVAGEKLVMPFMADVDPLKMAKIKEHADKVEVKGRPAAAAPSAPAAAGPAKSVSGTRVAPVVARETSSESVASSAAPSRKPSAVTVVGGKKPLLKKKAAGGGGKPPAAGGKAAGVSDDAQFTEKELAMEEAEMAVEGLLPAEVLKNIGDGLWKNRLLAMETFLRIVSSAADPASLPAQALILMVRRAPGLKDNNFQVWKLRIETVKAVASGGRVSRTTAGPAIPEITDKLGDPKVGAAAAEALTAIAESKMTGGLAWVGLEVLKHATSQKSPKVHTDGLLWLSQAVKEFGFNLPLKPVVEILKGSLAASQPAIRQAALTLIGTLSLYVGKMLRTFFDDRNAQILQQLDDELKKLEGLTAPVPTRGLAAATDGGDGDGSEAGAGGEPVAEINPEDLLPRVDIADQITSSVLERMGDKNWKTRAESLAEIKDIIGKAKFITPNIGDLPTALKARVSDLNKMLMMEALGICKQLAEAMGSKSRQHSRIFIPAIMSAFSDSKPQVRAVAKDCLDAWEDKIKLAGIFEGEMIADALKVENPTLRAELLAWLKSKMPEDGPIRGIAKEDVNACLQYLCLCLEDRNPDVRKNAQEVFFHFMVQVGTEAMTRLAGRVKPASKNGIIALIEKYKPQMPVKAAPPPPPAEPKAVRGGGGKPRTASSTAAQKAPEPSLDEDESEEYGGKGAAKAVKPGMKAPRQRAGMSKPSGTKKKDEEIDVTPLLSANNLKHTRFNDEARLKVLKWSFTTPREEFVELLREQFVAAGANNCLIANLFSPDFKMHIKALDSLMEISNNTEVIKANLDLLLKWLTLRFFETNPSVIIKGLEFVQGVLDELTCESYTMHDMEINCFVPYLLIKIGDPKEPIRTAAKRIIQKLPPMYPTPKLFSLVMDGLKSKNSRQRAECLDEMSCLIGNHGLKVCGVTPTVPLKEMAKHISDRDNTVRNAALNAVVQAYFLVGEKIFKMVGPLSEKDMSMLEERIKRAQRTTRPPSAAAMSQESVGASANASPPAGPTDLNATRVTGRGGVSGGGGGRRPVSAYFPSQQSPIPAREDKQLSPPAMTSVSRGLQFRQAAPPRAQSRLTEFLSLDVEAIERQMRPMGNRMPNLQPKLTEVEDFDMSMSYEAQTVEELRTKYLLPNATSSGVTTASSPSSFENPTNAVVNGLIKEMACSDADTSRRALCTMLAIVKTKESHEDLKPLLNQIVIVLNLLLKKSLVHELPFDDTMSDEFQIEYTHNAVELAFLLAMHENLISRVGDALFRELVRLLLLLMVDPGVCSSKDTLRYLNKFFSYSVKNSEPSINLCASLAVFREFLTSAMDKPHDEQKKTLVDIVMRLLWRIIRDVPFTTKTDCESILKEIHAFYFVFPREYWEDKTDKDKLPVKTVKKILTNLCKSRMPTVIHCYRKHPEYRETEVGRTIEQAEREKQLKRTSTEGLSGDTEGKLSREAHEELTVIFQKIGDKDESEEGIRLLHAFRERHPEADLEPFLVKSSQFFQQYIKAGLDKLDQQKRLSREAEAASTRRAEAMVGTPLHLGKPEAASPSGKDDDPLLYLDRLKKIRERFGLPLGSGENAAAPSNAGSVETPVDVESTSPFSPSENGSRDSSSHGSPGDENRDIVTAGKDADGSQTRQIPENINSLMKRFNQIKRGELK